MSWLSGIAASVLGISKTVLPFLKTVVIPFLSSNWPLIVSLWPVAQQFVKTASTKDISGQAKQDLVVNLLREELVKRGIVTKEEDASTSALQLLTLLAYRFVARKDPVVEASKE